MSLNIYCLLSNSQPHATLETRARKASWPVVFIEVYENGRFLYIIVRIKGE